MNRSQHGLFALALVALGLLLVGPARATTLQQVDRATWGASGVPSYVTMYIWAPDQLAENPPVVVACHSCGTAVSGYINSVANVRAAADRNGFIIIFPEATGRNCWDVGSSQSLTHDGGGDTQAVAQMIEYTLSHYNGDPSRVYILGGSSGGMMTQGMLAVYPDLFRAGAARAGVPAGCWADGYDASNQWSGNCAGGRTTKSAQQWGDQVRAMYPGYDGPRPRVMLFHGTADTTISYNNMGEAIKEWTNVLGLDTEPTSTDTVTTSVSTYDVQLWEDDCGYVVLDAWSGRNGTHSMAYEEDDILDFFGLNEAGGPDPWDAACGSSGGTGGAGGTGGTTGDGGAAGATAETGGAPNTGGAENLGGVGNTGNEPGTGGTEPGTGGAAPVTGGTGPATGGTAPATGGVPPGTGGVATGGVAPATGGLANTGGVVTGSGGTVPLTGGTSPLPGSGGAATGGVAPVGGAATGGAAAAPGTGGAAAAPASATSASEDDQGCGCRVAGTPAHRGGAGAGLALLVAFALGSRRRSRGRVSAR